MRKLLIAAAAILSLSLAGFAAACGGGDDETVDLPGGGEINVNEGVPDDFPDDFPIYDGADSKGGYSGEQDGVQGFYAVWETGDSAEDVIAFYESEFEDGPWTSEGSFNSAGTSLITVTNDSSNQAGGVNISEVDGTTTILAFVGDDPGQDTGVDSDDATSDDGSSDDGESSSDNGSSDTEDPPAAELPDEVDIQDDYPEDEIPLPDAARVTSSSSFGSGGQSTIFVTLYTEQSVDELETYYKDTLEAAGYVDSFSSSSDGEIYLTYTKNQDDPATAANATVAIRPSEVEGYSVVDISVIGPAPE